MGCVISVLICVCLLCPDVSCYAHFLTWVPNTCSHTICMSSDISDQTECSGVVLRGSDSTSWCRSLSYSFAVQVAGSASIFFFLSGLLARLCLLARFVERKGSHLSI